MERDAKMNKNADNNVIFLDIDGVLNCQSNPRLDQLMVRRLASIVHRTDASVILHSGWKLWFDEHMTPQTPEAKGLVEALAAEGLSLNDKTPDFSTPRIRKSKEFSQIKASEILSWLLRFPDIKNWCVIDDLDLQNDIIERHQIRPDPTMGLSEENAKKAVHLLLDKTRPSL